MTPFVYISLFTVLFIYSVLTWNRKDISQVVPFLFVILICYGLGFRGNESGTDTSEYVIYFLKLREGIETRNFELMFYFISKIIVHIFSIDYVLFIFLVLQLAFYFFGNRELGITNTLASVLLFLAFMPGLDLATSAVRNFTCVSVGILILSYVVRNRISSLWNIIPCLFHSSYVIVFALSFSRLQFNWIKLRIIQVISIIFFAFSSSVSSAFVDDLFRQYTSGYGIFSKLSRYLVLDNELFAPIIRLYFVVVSILITSFILFINWRVKESNTDIVFIKLANLTILGQAFYALVSFSDFAYRFFYIYYAIAICTLMYALSNYLKTKDAIVCYSALFVFGLFSTYSSGKFLRYELFTFL
ncbi:TPA: EpsG family protein [Vibrio parahaemolyticus]|nr:EpsG family protein [Vibrio parahaemolyticus]